MKRQKVRYFFIWKLGKEYGKEPWLNFPGQIAFLKYLKEKDGDFRFELSKPKRKMRKHKVKTLNLDELEFHAIMEALTIEDFSQVRAAKLLGISFRRLNYKINKHGITHHKWRINKNGHV